MELYHPINSSKRWSGNHQYYRLPLPDSANSDLCQHGKQRNSLIRIKAIKLALKQDSG